MALAIGIWLFDTSPTYNSTTADINKAMLQAFGVNKNEIGDSVMSRSPIYTDGNLSNKERKAWPGSKNPYTDLDWVIK